MNSADASTLPAAAALLRQWTEKGECLGGQVYVWRAGQVAADVAVGNSEPGRAAAATDVSRLYCAVKPLVACCLARAVDTCDASLDDNACQYLPEFKKDGRDSITLRQLMSHTSRLFDFPIDPYRCPAPDLFRIVCSYKAPAQSLYRRPYYNGTIAWVVLATVVERIYADPFVKIVTDMLSDSVPESRLRITNPDPACYVPCHLIKKGSFAPVPQPPHDILFRTPNPAHGGFGSAGDLGWLYAELVRCARGTGRLMGISTARQLIAGHCVVDVGLGFGLRTSGLGFMTDVRTDGLGGGWSRRSFGHAGYVGQHRVVHAFGDPDHEVAVAIQLFSVGAKNNWRFHKLGAAIWSDLLPGEERHDEAAS